MNIKRLPPNVHPLNSLGAGEIFEFNDIVYMKCSMSGMYNFDFKSMEVLNRFVDIQNINRCVLCVRLEDGVLWAIDKCLSVTRINVEAMEIPIEVMTDEPEEES